MPVERASPDQFIPLPNGFQDRHQFIGRYESLDVFHFDFYSMALSKLHRGNEKDFADIINMVNTELIEFQQLQIFFEEVHPQLELFSISARPENFRKNFTILNDRLFDRG